MTFLLPSLITIFIEIMKNIMYYFLFKLLVINLYFQNVIF